MTPDERLLYQELRDGIAKLAPLPAMVQRLEQKVDTVDETVRQVQIDAAAKTATQDTLLTQHEAALGRLADKIKDHTGQHWTWIMGATGIIAAVLAAAKLLLGKL